MVDLLEEMGMPTAFDPNGANFSRLGTPKPPHDNIFISNVIHKTFIEVDQIGTRAGAVTAVIMAGNFAVPPPPVPVILDRPFVFAIIDNATNLPIFIGTVLEIPE
jgi:serpin B